MYGHVLFRRGDVLKDNSFNVSNIATYISNPHLSCKYAHRHLDRDVHMWQAVGKLRDQSLHSYGEKIKMVCINICSLLMSLCSCNLLINC